MLSRWADAYARQIGQDVARVRRWISFMALGGALEQAGFAGDGPRFSIKGGVALELRLGGRARATRDLDLVFNHREGDLLEAFDELLQNGCEGFSFRRRNAPRVLRNGAIRADVAVQYGGSTWGKIQVDLARVEGNAGMEVEMVEGFDLSFFRFDFPERVSCLSIYAQAAQKIHAVSRPSSPGWENDRFKDLVDLLLIEELIHDQVALRTACEEVFANRNTHSWPPFIEAPSRWAEPFRRMARGIGLPVEDVNQAAFLVRRLLNDVEPNAELFRKVPVQRKVSATNWYYALGEDNRPHRVPVLTAEALLAGQAVPGELIRPTWYRDPGGVILIEVRVFLADRAPQFLDGIVVHEIGVESAAVGERTQIDYSVWINLADEILRRVGSDLKSREMLAGFLSVGDRVGANVMAELFGVTIRGALVLIADTFNSGNKKSPSWSFADGDIVVPVISNPTLT